MAVIQEVTTTQGFAAPAASRQQAATSEIAGTENRFLRLLVTQMKNQDPLNPLDNAQVTSQMAQLSTVSGIEKLNATMQAMAASFSSSQTLQATSMIGRGVLIPGSSIALEAGSPSFAGIELAGPADRVVVSIRDAAGNLVEQVDIGAHVAGVTAFQWDGATANGAAAPAGTYRFSVEATQGGRPVTASPLSFGRVQAVTPGAQGAQLTVGAFGNVPLSEIKQIVL